MAIQYFRRIPGLEEPTEQQIHTIVRLERDDLAGTAQYVRNSEQHGLFPIHVPTAQSVTDQRRTHELDLIAVHGLGGDALRTWQHDDGFNWLENIHEALPGVRVYSYGYDSVPAFATGIKGLSDFARHLLALIKWTRYNESHHKRRIVFICHGMGGLLAKQAILLANNERGSYQNICDCIAATLFFSTPQSGNVSERYSDTLVKIADAIMFPTLADELNENLRTMLLSLLRAAAPDFAEQREQYRTHAYGVRSFAFVEKAPLPGLHKVLVDEQSGRAWTRNERCLPIMNHDHRQICKFSSLSSESFQVVLDELQGIAKDVEMSESAVKTHPGDSPSSLVLVAQLRSDAVLKAAVAGSQFVLQRLIATGADINTRDDQQRTLLHLACQHGNAEVAVALLGLGAMVNTIDEHGSSPLHAAVARSDQMLVAAILERRGDTNVADKDGCTPLHCAAQIGDPKIVQSLLDNGADLSIRNAAGEAPVGVARKANRNQVRLQLIGHSSSADTALTQRPQTNRAGGYLTKEQRQYAYMAENFPSAAVMIMDMDHEISNRATDLAKAALRGDLDTVIHMLDVGHQPEPVALYLAAKEHRSDVVSLLADVMSDIDADAGWTGNALCAASCSDTGYATVQVLLEKGADVNWQGGKYGGPLQSATANFALTIIKLLLKHGADVNAQCGHYGNAMTAAARHRTNFAEVSTLLLEHGADINAHGPGEYGNALQTAVHRQHADNVEFLLRHGASKKMPGRFGSAVEIAHGQDFLKDRSKGEERDRILFLLKDEDDLFNELFAEA